MGRDVAGKVIIGVLLYFVFLTFAFHIVGEFNSEFGLDNDYITQSGGTLGFDFVDGLCDEPRLSQYGFTYEDSNNPNCEVLQKVGVVYDKESCESFQGSCEWVADYSLLDGLIQKFNSDYAPEPNCKGQLNLTYFNNGNSSFTDSVSLLGYTSNNYPLYEMELLNVGTNAKQYCEVLGFTWYNEQEIKELLTPTGYLQTFNLMNQAFTFRLDFISDYDVLNVFLSFVFLWLPLIVLSLAGYIMIR